MRDTLDALDCGELLGDDWDLHGLDGNIDTTRRPSQPFAVKADGCLDVSRLLAWSAVAALSAFIVPAP